MKLRRRYKRGKNEDDEECLIEDSHPRVREHSKVCDLSIVGWFLFTVEIFFRYVDGYGNLPKVHGKHLRLDFKQLSVVNLSV